MMRKIFAITLAVFLLMSCAGRENKSNKELKYDKWVESLDDSIKSEEDNIRLTEDSIRIYHEEIGKMLKLFSYVDNPRQVEGYTILSSWKNRYPLTSTGIVARITKSERFELIAVLRGGNFNQISVLSGDTVISSDVVPYDQALNYRTGGLNTVAFSGIKADSIGRFISTHENKTVTVRFLPSSSTLKLSGEQLVMIAVTWRMYSTQKNVERMERSLPLMHKKIDAYRRIKDSNAK